jgi:hypothetical protein
MAESIGRFKRITAEEAHQHLTSTPPANAFSNQLATLFATLEPFEHYELALNRKENAAVIRERIMRFVQENAIDGVQVRAGRQYGKNTVIVWRELRQQAHQDSSVQDPPADISPGAEEGDEINQPAETGNRAAALATGGPKGENLEPPPPEAGQSIMASDTTPEEEQEGKQDHQP